MHSLGRLLRRIGKRRSPAVIAHRGSSRVSPENTIAAFDIAIEDGADAVEFDVRLTADGQLVVIHDTRLSRTAQSMRKVSSMNADDVASMDAGSWFHKEFRGQLVPMLEEALSTLKGRVVPIIEIKDAGEVGVDAARRLVDVLSESGMSEDVIVASGSSKILDVVARLSPETPLAGVAARSSSCLAAIEAYGGCLVWWRSFSPKLVKAARDADGFVATWVTPRSKVTSFARAGVDALITDDPAETIRLLESPSRATRRNPFDPGRLDDMRSQASVPIRPEDKRRLDAMADEWHELAQRIDAAYATGATGGVEVLEDRAEQILAELEAASDDLTEGQHDGMLHHEEELPGLEEELARLYDGYIRTKRGEYANVGLDPYPGGPADTLEGMLAHAVRWRIMERVRAHGGPEAFRGRSVTDDQAVAAARDAYERALSLRAKFAGRKLPISRSPSAMIRAIRLPRRGQ